MQQPSAQPLNNKTSLLAPSLAAVLGTALWGLSIAGSPFVFAAPLLALSEAMAISGIMIGALINAAGFRKVKQKSSNPAKPLSYALSSLAMGATVAIGHYLWQVWGINSLFMMAPLVSLGVIGLLYSAKASKFTYVAAAQTNMPNFDTQADLRQTQIGEPTEFNNALVSSSVINTDRPPEVPHTWRVERGERSRGGQRRRRRDSLSVVQAPDHHPRNTPEARQAARQEYKILPARSPDKSQKDLTTKRRRRTRITPPAPNLIDNPFNFNTTNATPITTIVEDKKAQLPASSPIEAGGEEIHTPLLDRSLVWQQRMPVLLQELKRLDLREGFSYKLDEVLNYLVSCQDYHIGAVDVVAEFNETCVLAIANNKPDSLKQEMLDVLIQRKDEIEKLPQIIKAEIDKISISLQKTLTQSKISSHIKLIELSINNLSLSSRLVVGDKKNADCLASEETVVDKIIETFKLGASDVLMKPVFGDKIFKNEFIGKILNIFGAKKAAESNEIIKKIELIEEYLKAKYAENERQFQMLAKTIEEKKEKSGPIAKEKLDIFSKALDEASKVEKFSLAKNLVKNLSKIAVPAGKSKSEVISTSLAEANLTPAHIEFLLTPTFWADQELRVEVMKRIAPKKQSLTKTLNTLSTRVVEAKILSRVEGVGQDLSKTIASGVTFFKKRIEKHQQSQQNAKQLRLLSIKKQLDDISKIAIHTSREREVDAWLRDLSDRRELSETLCDAIFCDKLTKEQSLFIIYRAKLQGLHFMDDEAIFRDVNDEISEASSCTTKFTKVIQEIKGISEKDNESITELFDLVKKYQMTDESLGYKLKNAKMTQEGVAHILKEAHKADAINLAQVKRICLVYSEIPIEQENTECPSTSEHSNFAKLIGLLQEKKPESSPAVF